MTPPKLWYRQFIRKNVPDPDILADNSYVSTNLTDFFGKWLQEGSNASLMSFDAILSPFWQNSQLPTPKNTFSIFCVADGGLFPSSTYPDVDQGIRFVTFLSSGSEEPFQDETEDSWTLCIIGSEFLDSETDEGFVQVACWDGGAFRFYQRNKISGANEGGKNSGVVGWIYMGNSRQAFSDSNQYLGPFNGHVNGALVMKELRKPWLHWKTDTRSLTTNFPPQTQARFLTAPYLSDPIAKTLFSNVSSAETMERFVESSIYKWYLSRKKSDFFSSPGQLVEKPKNVQRWMAHLLLTTTTNIVCAIKHNGEWRVNRNMFYNYELFSRWDACSLLKNIKFPTFSVPLELYNIASKNLGLSLIQEVPSTYVPTPSHSIIHLPLGTLGGGKMTASYTKQSFIKISDSESPPNSNNEGLFTILQPSYEDTHGLIVLSSLNLLSPTILTALLMLDFWNPVYSWRRGVLFQYLPSTISLLPSSPSHPNSEAYDLSKIFISNIKSSKLVKEGIPSPEREFLSLLEGNVEEFRERIKAYFEVVDERLKMREGIEDYLRLAESRRRVFRPLPLCEFGLSLPYALNYTRVVEGVEAGKERKEERNGEGVRWEVLENGQISVVCERGMEFWRKWDGSQEGTSLAGFDPKIVPGEEGWGDESVGDGSEKMGGMGRGGCSYLRGKIV